MSKQHHIEFSPIGRRGKVPDDTSLLESARLFGVDLTGDCGGFGVCGSCQVRLLAGDVSEITDNEDMLLSPDDLEEGYRLACMTYPQSDCKIGIPPESLDSPMRSQVESEDATVDLNPAVYGLDVDIPSPSIDHPLADADSMLQALPADAETIPTIDLGILHTLSDDLRAHDWRMRVSVHQQRNEIVAVRSSGAREVGLAVDLGSTGIAGYLVDLCDGETLAAQGMMNPQISYGEDIISRINYAFKTPGGAQTLRNAVVEGLNQLVGELCENAGVQREDVVDVVIVGNTVLGKHMLHFD